MNFFPLDTRSKLRRTKKGRDASLTLKMKRTSTGKRRKAEGKKKDKRRKKKFEVGL